MTRNAGKTSAESRRRAAPGTSAREWAVAAAGAALVLGAVAFMLYEAAVSREIPPDLQVRVDSIVEATDGYVVQFRVLNAGQQTASDLLLEGELRNGSEIVESAQATISYVPGRSSRPAGLVFTRDPRRHTLEIRPRGYDLP